MTMPPNDNEPSPLLVLSQDYELFFQNSGSIEKCLFEPTELLLSHAASHNLKLTFFIDTGMLRRFDHYAPTVPELARSAAAVRRNLETIDRAGHELALHIHPHWEDTRWHNGAWDFSGTRYQLREFSESEVDDIFRSNFALLQALSSRPVTSYRAGGFCIEPFSRTAPVMRELGLVNESSVVPGMHLKDPSKGFDFSSVRDTPWWYFCDSPLQPKDEGEFLELAITPMTVSRFFYWGRMVQRLSGDTQSAKLGDGVSKAIGRKEILRRLAGMSRTSELSIDDAKADVLARADVRRANRKLWHLMGHPKLLSPHSLQALADFRDHKKLANSLTVAAASQAIRNGAL